MSVATTPPDQARASQSVPHSGPRPADRRTDRRGRASEASTPRRAAANRAPGVPRWIGAIPFEVHDPVAIGRDEDLAEVVVGMDPGDEGHRYGCLEETERLHDPGCKCVQDGRGLAADEIHGLGKTGTSRPPPRPDLCTRRVARFQVGDPVRRREGRVQARCERPQVRGNIRRLVHPDLGRVQHPAGERLRKPLVGIRPSRDKGLGKSDRLRPVRDRHQFSEPGQRRDRGNPASSLR